MDTTAHTNTTSSAPDAPANVITCPVHGCDDGTVLVEVAGGAWNSYLGGYEPDEEPEPCDVCHGFGVIDVTRCDACGLVAENDTAADMLASHEVCTCDAEVHS